MEQTEEQRLAELREQRSKFRSLVRSEGWAELVRVVNAQALTREYPVLRTSTNLENLGEHNFMKGEAAGMRALIALPATVIESASQQLKDEEDDE